MKDVTWKKLGEVVKTVAAYVKLKSGDYCLTGKIPIIDQGVEFIAGYTDEEITPVEIDEYVIFGDHSEHIKYVNFSFVQGADGLKILRPISNNAKYIYYAFQNFYQKELNYKRHWSSAKKTPIPLPPLPIQAEIVRILDVFTELTTELTTELNMRKKQYQYYLNALLNFEGWDNVEWKKLGEVGEYSKQRISCKHLDKTSYVGVDNLLQNRAGKTESIYVPTEGNFTQYRDEDILIGNIRPYLKKIWYADRIGGSSGDVLVIHITDRNLNSRYLYQILANEKFFDYNMQHAKGAKMPRGNKDKIMEYRFPLPPLSIQAEIVRILDQFDNMINSISGVLARLVELSQKQYECYINLLLSFPKSEKDN